MDHWKGLSTVFNCWNFCFTIITQWWAMLDFITQNGLIFHKIFKIFVVINQKLCDVCGQKLVWVVSTIGTTNTISFVKIRQVTQNSLLIWHGVTHRQIWEGAKGTFPSLELFLPPIHTSQLHACMQRSLDKLTEVLHYDPQKYSLRAVTTPIEQSVQY